MNKNHKLQENLKRDKIKLQFKGFKLQKELKNGENNGDGGITQKYILLLRFTFH